MVYIILMGVCVCACARVAQCAVEFNRISACVWFSVCLCVMSERYELKRQRKFRKKQNKNIFEEIKRLRYRLKPG